MLAYLIARALVWLAWLRVRRPSAALPLYRGALSAIRHEARCSGFVTESGFPGARKLTCATVSRYGVKRPDFLPPILLASALAVRGVGLTRVRPENGTAKITIVTQSQPVMIGISLGIAPKVRDGKEEYDKPREDYGPHGR